MPQRNRSRRAAARQTQLGQRKKRQVKGPSGAPDNPAPATAARPEPGVVPGIGPIETPIPQPAVAPRIRPRTKPEAMTSTSTSTYIGPEMKRIMVLSSLILAVLIVLSFVVS